MGIFLEFFYSGAAYTLVFFALIAAIIWFVWALGFNRE